MQNIINNEMNYNQGINLMDMPKINNNCIPDNIKKINIAFEDSEGDKKLLSFPFGTTVESALKKYLEINPKARNQKNLLFLYKATKIEENNNTKIENYFEAPVVKILVMYD